MDEEQLARRWDQSADTYDEAYRALPFYAEVLRRIVTLADPGPDDSVLDIGTGTGELALQLAPRAKRVVGIDISERMLERARQKARQRGITNVEFRQGSFTDPALEERFEIVVSNLAFEWVPDPDKRRALDAMSERLCDAGRFILGERMWFSGVEDGPDRILGIFREWFAPIARAQGKSLEELQQDGEDLARRHPETIDRVRRDHQEIQWQPDNLRRLLQEKGFAVDLLEEVAPMLGLLVATKAKLSG